MFDHVLSHGPKANEADFAEAGCSHAISEALLTFVCSLNEIISLFHSNSKRS